MSIDVPKPYGPNAWIVGEIFMRHYFTTFDRGSKPNTARVCVSPMKMSPDVSKVPELSGAAVNQLKFLAKGTQSASSSSAAATSTVSAGQVQSAALSSTQVSTKGKTLVGGTTKTGAWKKGGVVDVNDEKVGRRDRRARVDVEV